MGYAKGPYQVQDLDLQRISVTPRFPRLEIKDDGSLAARNISNWKLTCHRPARAVYARRPELGV